MATFIVGLCLAVLLFWSFNRTRKDMKNSKCGGCSGCGLKNQCNSSTEIREVIPMDVQSK